MIHKTAVELSAEAREAATVFFRSRAGTNFLEALAAVAPTIPKSGSAEDRIAGAYTHAGYEECIDTIQFFITPEEKDEAPKQNYPDIEDDNAWDQEQTRVETAKQ